jgi:S-(hydroxymethyl)glutathione dehydrogenase/alcohol dehydrogenase
MRIKAAVLYRHNEPLVVEEVELDPPKAGEVLVKLKATGICHSDVSVYNGHIPVGVPVIMGHEGAGEIVEVGEGVTRFKPGDHVLLSYLPSCGRCRWCHIGQPNLCELGAHLRDGKMLDGTARHHRVEDGSDINSFVFISTFGEYSVAPEASLVPVPDHVPLEKICIMGCGFTTGFSTATKKMHIKPGETVTIIGCGGLGLAAIQGVHLMGAGKIIAVDLYEEKLEMARKFGATHTIKNTRDVDAIIEEIMEITWGVGTDFSIEYVGMDQSDETLDIAFQAIRKGGTMYMVGVADEDHRTLPFDPYTLTLWRKKVVGVLSGDAQFQVDIPRFISLYEQGQINLDDMITKELTLEQINEGFENVLAGNRVARQVIRYD